MKKCTPWITLLIALMALSGCSFNRFIEQNLSAADREVIDRIHKALVQQDYEYIRGLASEQVINDAFYENLRNMTALMPAADPTAEEIVGLMVHQSGIHKQIQVTTQFTYGQQSILTQIVLSKTGENLILHGFNVQPLAQPLTQLNGFSFKQKGLLHYVVFIGLMLIFLFVVWTFIVCWKMKTLKSRIVWLFFILMGVGTWHFNWSTGASMLQPLSIQLLSVSFIKSGLYAPWVFGLSLPIGAIMFWMFKAQLAHKVDAKTTDQDS